MKATVLLDSYSWVTGRGEQRETHDAVKGDVIDVSDEEFKRGLGMAPQGLAEGEVAVKAIGSGLSAIVTDGEPELGPPTESTGRPAKGAGRDKWNAYASSLRNEDGSAAIEDPTSYAKKDEIVKAVEKAEAAGATAPASASAPVAATTTTTGPLAALPDDLLTLDESELIPIAKARGVQGAEEMSRDELIGEILGAPGSSHPVASQATPATP